MSPSFSTALRHLAAVVLASLAWPLPAHGDVVEATPESFTVLASTEVSAVPRALYLALVTRVGSWWDPEQTVSGRAEGLSIDDRVGGCFCEELSDGSRVRYMAVVETDRGTRLRLEGSLGPLQALAVTGTLTLSLIENDGRTRIEALYTVDGSAPGGLESLAGPVDDLISLQIQRLKRFIEAGRPD